jgi:hypothetical protein
VLAVARGLGGLCPAGLVVLSVALGRAGLRRARWVVLAGAVVLRRELRVALEVPPAPVREGDWLAGRVEDGAVFDGVDVVRVEVEGADADDALVDCDSVGPARSPVEVTGQPEDPWHALASKVITTATEAKRIPLSERVLRESSFIVTCFSMGDIQEWAWPRPAGRDGASRARSSQLADRPAADHEPAAGPGPAGLRPAVPARQHSAAGLGSR